MLQRWTSTVDEFPVAQQFLATVERLQDEPHGWVQTRLHIKAKALLNRMEIGVRRKALQAVVDAGMAFEP